jgi:alpha-L-fucosidase
MGYVVLTTRHHDGFALWDTRTSEFNAARLGPKRDLVAPYAEAIREAGLKVGFYYSPAAWTHPDYPGAYFRDWPAVTDWRDEASRRRFVAYYREQVRELMTGYGKIDMLWFDGCIPENLDGEETHRMVRQLQPDIVVNNRLGPPYDFHCCEQAIKPAAPGQPWEACMTLNANWGYHAGDHDWKPPKEVIGMLITCAASGGNLLLNVGPKPDGTIPEESATILRETGRWLARNREFLPNSRRHPISWNNSGKITAKGNTLYLHIFHSTGNEFCFAELANQVMSARCLATGQPIDFTQDGERLWLRLPEPLPDSPVTTIALDLDGAPQAHTKTTSFWAPG